MHDIENNIYTCIEYIIEYIKKIPVALLQDILKIILGVDVN